MVAGSAAIEEGRPGEKPEPSKRQRNQQTNGTQGGSIATAFNNLPRRVQETTLRQRKPKSRGQEMLRKAVGMQCRYACSRRGR